MKVVAANKGNFVESPLHGRIAIVIPTLNEAQHILGVISALAGSAERLGAQIIVVDGGSTDSTPDQVAAAALRDKRLVLLHNPKRLQAAAVNLVVARFGDHLDWIIRVDAHASYPDDYCDVLLAEARRTLADSVVVRMKATATGRAFMQTEIAAAQNASFGNGGSAHRGDGEGRFTDHGHHALMRVQAFSAVGGYDEAFSHAEDVELDQRFVTAGYRIWLTGATRMNYYPRENLAALAKQYYRFGAGRMANAWKHPRSLRTRHLILISLAPVAMLGLLSPVVPLFALPVTIWLLACLSAGVLTALRMRTREIVLCGLPGAVMQLAWSFGFWSQGIRYVLRSPDRKPSAWQAPLAQAEE